MIFVDGQNRSAEARHPRARRQRDGATPLICFSHLRWSFVWQRPQHLLSRMAQSRAVYVVEEPVFEDEAPIPSLRLAEDAGVTILTPVLPSRHGLPGGFGSGANPFIRSLLSQFFGGETGSIDATVWYYTPMALGALPANVFPDIVVFDAMDELSNFLGAPEDLVSRENRLLRTADLVFAGGPSLYQRRKHLNPHAHCFPSGVDAAHFSAKSEIPPSDIATLRGPVIGFYGVLDERIDLGLLDALARMRPEWSLALIGPVAKIEEGDLPRRDNIHYFGMRTYGELPAYLQCFDAAILPFAINDATKFISPTKTLEYLAGGKPIVSTPIKDVMELYGSVVEIASTPADFVDAIERLWAEPGPARLDRRRRIRAVLARHDWDVIAANMGQLMDDALRARANRPVAAMHPAAWTDRTPLRHGAVKSEVGD
jgi:UDP-galactopyranose mutase